MSEPKEFLNIYAEQTPNPETMKFVFNKMILPDDAIDFPTREKAQESPLAKSLFEFSFVNGVFIMNNFVTITKSERFEWHDIIAQLKQQIKQYLEEEKPVIQVDLGGSLAPNADEPEIDRKIKEILNEYVRPAVESDGGFIGFHSFDKATGIVKVLLQGACSGCPSSSITLKMGIENLLKRMIPDVQSVVAEGV